jgi:hypothetical protein|tara:strand:- start:1390 stop:1833 length:444 start_codon:yes stop_codon:yes gene_type:complete
MTMHLERGLTTLNTTKRKKKQKSDAFYVDGWREHNKFLKRMKLDKMSLEEYIDYVQGKYKPKSKPSASNFEWNASGGYRKEQKHIPSRISKHSFAPATKKETMQYTGERKLVGIAMMHKSNLVPVFADDDDKTGSKQATEIAQMRRN